MKRRSALDSLCEVRARARDAQRIALGRHLRDERQAVERGRAATVRVDKALERSTHSRRLETHRLRHGGVLASEGRLHDAWQQRQRIELATLTRHAQIAGRTLKLAQLETRNSQSTLARLSGELDLIQRRLKLKRAAESLRRDAAAYDAQDDATLYRMLRRNKAPQ